MPSRSNLFAPRHRLRRAAVVSVSALVLLTASCSSGSGKAEVKKAADTAKSTVTTSVPAVTGAACPYVLDESKADFYPIQPSFSAGYVMAVQKLTTETANWAYVVQGDFPYSNWTAWYLYNLKGVPQFKFSDSSITPDAGSTNPFVQGNPILAPKRSFTLYFMPATTPASVVSTMQSQGKNVALMPKVGSTDGVSIVSRSYWSFAKDGLGDYDRSGYGGPTNTPYPTIQAVTTDPTTGALTNTPVANCGAQSELPQKLWYNRETGKPAITFEHASPPSATDIGADLPGFLVQTGSVAGSFGSEFPPSPVADQVQFYRNVASQAPYADVQSAPPEGDPPDACGGYVMANVPNGVVSVIRVPQVPSYPDYQGATSATLNNHDAFDVQFYSVVVYGASKQLDAYGTTENSQLGNRQIEEDADGGATFVLYPNGASSQQVGQIAAVARANGWNLLKGGVQTAVAPNLVVVREKGQNSSWTNALSANQVTQGAPCPQSTNPSVKLPQDPPSAAVTQTNGMGLSAPAGQNCAVAEFLSGTCVQKLSARLAQSSQVWSAKHASAPAQKSP